MYKEKTKLSKAFKANLFILLGLIWFIFIPNNAFGQKKLQEFKTSDEYIQVVKHYRYLNPDSAIAFVKAGLEKSIRDKDKLGEAALLNQYGMIEDNAVRYRESRQNYLKAEAIYLKENNEKGLASTFIRLGVVEKRKGNYDKSLFYYLKSLQLSEKNRDMIGMLEARVVLSEIYFDLEDFRNCLKNLEIAEKIDKKIPFSNFSLNMYISYANYFIKFKQYDAAINYIKIGLSKSSKVEYNGSKIGLLKLLGRAYFKKGNTTEAIASLKEALKFSKEIKNVLREQSNLLDLAEVYAKINQDTSLAYLNQALNIVSIHKMYQQEIVVLNKIAAVYKKRKDFEMALALNEKSYQLSEEFYHKDMMKQISNLESDYELEKSNAQLSELKLDKQKDEVINNIVLSIAITVTLLFVITLVYFNRARHLNKLLRQANKKLEDSNEEKDKFFSIVAHDIRSPLASTVSVLKFIANRELDDETQDEVVNKLALHCESSLGVLDKLLRWGQMQIKGVKINITEFEPIKNINANMAILKEAAEHKHININLSLPEKVIVKADSDHFDFVIRNLLANAIKFTPINGNVNLYVQMQGVDMVSFKISDNGVGISQNRIKKIFELSAIGTKGTSEEEGTSLGLLICKEFIDANNGSFTVESEVSKGTTFIFTLPGYVFNLG